MSEQIPHGLDLGPLLFPIYINDIAETVQHCYISLFADDICLFIEVDNHSDAANCVNRSRLTET